MTVNRRKCKCGIDAVRTIGVLAFCTACADRFLEPIRARHIAKDEGRIGLGRQIGQLRPDWGERWAELGCCVCRATWTGPIGEPCTWCLDRHEVIIGAQRAVLLRPDLPDEGDADWPRALRIWAERLAHSINSGLVTEHEARTAWNRRVRHAA